MMDEFANYALEQCDWFGDYPRETLRCKRCGSTDVYWQSIVKVDGREGWRLHDEETRKPHICKPSLDAFDVVPE